jgi:arsenite transporter
MVADWEYASVNLVVAVLIWAMVYPMMVAVDFASLRHIHKRPKGLVITLAVNWLIKPFTMAALGVLFFEYVFADLIDPADAGQYIAGLILLGAAPCTAMVFIWSQLTRGRRQLHAGAGVAERHHHDLRLCPDRGASAGRDRHRGAVADAAAVGRALRRHSAGRRCRDPRGTGEPRRRRGRRALGEARVARFIAAVKPFSILGLLATVVLLFGFQGHVILDRPLLIALIAVPLSSSPTASSPSPMPRPGPGGCRTMWPRPAP